MDYAPGLKFVELVPRNPELSPERFHYHWHTIHGRRLAREACATLNGGTMNRYTQNHRIHPGVEGLAPLDYDGIVEGWFDDVDALEGLWNVPAYQEKVRPDEPGLADLPNTVNLLAHERTWLDRGTLPESAAKLAIAIRRSDGMSDADLDAALVAHGERFSGVEGLLEFSQARVFDEKAYVNPGGVAPLSGVDAVELIAWADVMELERGWDALRPEFLADLASFADLDASAAMVTDHRVIF